MGQSFTPELIRLLRIAGCTFVRHGKDDHGIWYSPVSCISFPVDNTAAGRRTAFNQWLGYLRNHDRKARPFAARALDAARPTLQPWWVRSRWRLPP